MLVGLSPLAAILIFSLLAVLILISIPVSILILILILILIFILVVTSCTLLMSPVCSQRAAAAAAATASSLVISAAFSDGQQQVLRGHTRYVCAVCVLPGGTHMASGGDDKAVKIWAVHEDPARCTVTIHCGSEVYSLLPLGPGHLLAGLNNGTIVKLDLSGSGSIAQTWRGHSYTVSCLALLPDGYTVFSGSLDNALKLWDSRSVDRDGKGIATLEGHTEWVVCLTLLPRTAQDGATGQRAVAGGGELFGKMIVYTAR